MSGQGLDFANVVGNPNFFPCKFGPTSWAGKGRLLNPEIVTFNPLLARLLTFPSKLDKLYTIREIY